MGDKKDGSDVPDNMKPPGIENIDLSKISNFEAASATDKTFEKTVQKAQSKKSGKFNFTEAELIPLPSGGRLYKSVTKDKDVLNGYIAMRQMTIKEEEILSTSRFLKAGSATRMILDRCIVSDIDAKDILLFDSNFLMFYLRSISYGDEYEFEIKCENSICEKKFKHQVEISKLAFEELDEDVVEPIKVTLPRSKYEVSFILPRLAHSEELILKSKERVKSADDEDKRMIDNLLVTTLRIKDNEGNDVKETDWEEFFESIPVMDSAKLREVSKFDTGVDELKHITCPYCETEQESTIPIGTDFFRF